METLNKSKVFVSVSSRSYLFPNQKQKIAIAKPLVFPSPLGVIYFQIGNIAKAEAMQILSFRLLSELSISKYKEGKDMFATF